MNRMIGSWLMGGLSILLMLGIAGCGDETTNNYTGPAPGGTTTVTNSDTVTLQGKLMDAVTGASLGGSDLKLWLIQGNLIRTPNRLIVDTRDPLVGEYLFTDIPVGTSTDNKVFKVVAIKENFQRFEGEISFAQAAAGAFRDQSTNRIRNIYLYPEGLSAPDYSYQVTHNGRPVPGVTVMFQPVLASNAAITSTTTNVLTATPGYLQSLIGTTDNNGYVTFAGADLAIGAGYNLFVLPVVFEGVSLGYNDPFSTVIVGKTGSNVTGIVALSDLAPGTNPYGLYVKSISNSISDQINSAGELTIVFSRPVTVSGNFTATEDSPSGVLATAPNHSVKVSMSLDGLTMTLSPNWATPPVANERDTMISYDNGTGFVSVNGYPDSVFRLFGLNGLTNAAGNPISGNVALTLP